MAGTVLMPALSYGTGIDCHVLDGCSVRVRARVRSGAFRVKVRGSIRVRNMAPLVSCNGP